MPIQEINIRKEKKTEKKKTVAYGGAAKSLATSGSSHLNKIMSGTDVTTCPYCGHAMRKL